MMTKEVSGGEPRTRRDFLRTGMAAGLPLLLNAEARAGSADAPPAGVIRTPEARFANLADYPFAPHYQYWRGMRMHYVDEGEGPVILLVHGQPTWSYLYRKMIPPLVAAGYRCIAPDHIGFGKSDKVTDDKWYVIERHIEALRFLIEALDLRGVTLVCQDWGGPISLRQAVDMPERFARLTILNTWLHHHGMIYTEAAKRYRASIKQLPPGTGDVPTGRLGPAYDAPFPDPSYKAGARRFPLLHPYAMPVEGNAADQARCFEVLKYWPKPAHLIFSESDPIFTVEWGKTWAGLIPGATFDTVPGGHFLQESSGPQIAAIMLNRIKEEK